MRSEKYEENGCVWFSVINVRLFRRRSLEDVIVWRPTAGTIGKRVQTSAWQSSRLLLTVGGAPSLEKFLVPFSLNINSVIFLVMSMAIDFTHCSSTSRPMRKMFPRLPIDVKTAPSSGNSGTSNGIPSVEPKVSQWYAVSDNSESWV